ncbi:MAG: patatin-like phospholipase family protein [bacterium]
MRKKNALIISGGGAWGAYGGGTLSRLDNDYDTIIGISTGALLAPFSSVKRWDILKEAYTSINQTNIFDKSWYKPYPISKKGRIRKLPIILSLIFGDKSISTSKNLRKLIDEYFFQDIYDQIISEKKRVLVGVQNYAQDPSILHHFNILEEDFSDFKDWMWASANAPFFTSLLNKSWRDTVGNFHVGQWTDGGLTEFVSFGPILNTTEKYSTVDIILHRNKKDIKYEGYGVNNFLGNVTRGIDAMRYDIEFENFYNKIEHLNKRGTTVNLYWLPRKLSPNSLMFDQKLMTEWWEEGYETALDLDRIDTFKP